MEQAEEYTRRAIAEVNVARETRDWTPHFVSVVYALLAIAAAIKERP
jgi:hypothetical protein